MAMLNNQMVNQRDWCELRSDDSSWMDASTQRCQHMFHVVDVDSACFSATGHFHGDVMCQLWIEKKQPGGAHPPQISCWLTTPITLW